MLILYLLLRIGTYIILLLAGVMAAYGAKAQSVLKGRVIDTHDTSLTAISVKVSGVGGTSTDANRPGTIDVDAKIASYPIANPADIKSFLA